MTAMPAPVAATPKISTVSRRRLKYWPNIKVAVSRVMPTPKPEFINKINALKQPALLSKSFNITYHDSVAEVQLMELTGEGGEQASQRGDQPAQHGGQPGRFAPADSDRQGRSQQGQGQGQGAQET